MTKIQEERGAQRGIRRWSSRGQWGYENGRGWGGSPRRLWLPTEREHQHKMNIDGAGENQRKKSLDDDCRSPWCEHKDHIWSWVWVEIEAMLYFKFHSIVRANFYFRYFAHPPQKFNGPLFLLFLFMNMERFGPDQAPEWLSWPVFCLGFGLLSASIHKGE